MLEEGRYDVVVGNPPYITPKDKALNQIYRAKYSDVCKGTYALTVPFMKLMFFPRQARRDGGLGRADHQQLLHETRIRHQTHRELPCAQDLRLVADTSGAYIPGHGTPTVIIVGRNRAPVGKTVRAVLGIRGEPGRPEIPAKGLVWSAIVDHIDEPGWNDDWITITDLDRKLLATHPWSLSGGGAVELAEAIERSSPGRVSERSTLP